MDFSLSSDTIMLRDMLRRFVQKEAHPLEMKYFTTGKLEPEEKSRLRTAIEQLGLWGITVPEAFGGFGLDMVTACVVMEELGQTFIPVDIGEVLPMLYACQGEQIQRFLEPTLNGERHVFLAGREPNAPHPDDWQTKALANHDAYTLNGCKTFVAIPEKQDFLIVLAHTVDGITAFLVDADNDGITWQENGASTLYLRNCRVSADEILGESGQALSLGKEEAARFCIRLGARHLGLAQRLLEMVTSYVNDWVVFDVALSQRPAVQGFLADLQIRIESVRWLVYHTAWQVDQGEPLRILASQVRLATVSMLKEAVDLVTMMYGGPGPSPQLEIQRFVETKLPAAATELGLAYARTAIASDLLSRNGV